MAKPSRPNDLGVRVVRFAPGTTPAAMRQAVQQAGGRVVTDLSKIGAMAVASRTGGLSGRLRAGRDVEAVWTDRVSVTPTALAPDPLHDEDVFAGENAPGVLQWEDDRGGVRQAWATTTGSPDFSVAVLDTGVVPSHREIKENLLFNRSTIPCDELKALFGDNSGPRDCAEDDREGHGTWVASRIAGDDNGFASNGIAPDAKIMSFKVLAVGSAA
jgi:lantibiotic leader peptide-processing serine protease